MIFKGVAASSFSGSQTELAMISHCRLSGNYASHQPGATPTLQVNIGSRCKSHASRSVSCEAAAASGPSASYLIHTQPRTSRVMHARSLTQHARPPRPSTSSLCAKAHRKSPSPTDGSATQEEDSRRKPVSVREQPSPPPSTALPTSHQAATKPAAAASNKAGGPSQPRGETGEWSQGVVEGSGPGWLQKLTDSKATVLERAAFFDNIIARGTSILESISAAAKVAPVSAEDKPESSDGSGKDMSNQGGSPSKSSKHPESSMHMERGLYNDVASKLTPKKKRPGSVAAASTRETVLGKHPASNNAAPAPEAAQVSSSNSQASSPTQDAASSSDSSSSGKADKAVSDTGTPSKPKLASEQNTEALGKRELELAFNLAYGTIFGQRLGVVGSAEQLGSWDVTQCLVMDTDDGVRWSGKCSVACSDAPTHLEYKYVVLNEADKQVTRWQEGDNVSLVVPQSAAAVLVTDFWDRTPSVVEVVEAPQQSSETPRHNLETLKHRMDTPEQSLETPQLTPQQILETPQQTPQQSLETSEMRMDTPEQRPQQRMEAPQQTPETRMEAPQQTSQQSLETPRQSLETPEQNLEASSSSASPSKEAAASDVSSACENNNDGIPIHGTNSLVRVSWSLQYTCAFGEQVALIGQGAQLGDWDAGSRLQLEWNEGDLWTGSAVFNSSETPQLEYKFVICNAVSGEVVVWQPGYNCILDVSESRGLDVFETWDQSGRVMCQHQGSGGDSPTTVALELPPEEGEYSEDYQGGQIVLFESSAEAMIALDAAVKAHEATLSSVDDPTSLEAILADRRLAESFNNILAYEQKMLQPYSMEEAESA